MKVIKYLFLLFYLGVTVNIPVFLHYCEMSGAVGFASCEMCEVPIEDSCCSEGSDSSAKENFTSQEETCCSSTFTNINTESTLPVKAISFAGNQLPLGELAGVQSLSANTLTVSSTTDPFVSPPSSYPSITIQNQVFRI